VSGPLQRKAVEVRIVAELRRLAGNVPNMAELRHLVEAELGQCSPAGFAGAVQALRYQGKLSWDRLELSPSMVAQSDGEEPSTQSCGAPLQAEGGAAAAKATSPPSNPGAGPDDEDDEDYPGGVNDIAEETGREGPTGDGPLPAEGEARHVPDALRHDQPALPVGGVEEPRSDPADDQPAGAGDGRQTDAGGAKAVPPLTGFVPKPLLHQAGIHAAQTRAAAKPPPAPAHEPEISRLVREEATAAGARRYRARSTGTVRQPLELLALKMPDLSLVETVSSMLAEDPHDLVAAIHRKHPPLWRRILQLGRATGQRPAEALYAALERGLDELEQSPPAQRADAA
jgi:hypothetical protein